MAGRKDIGTGVASVFESIASGVSDQEERQQKPKRKGRKIKALTQAVEEYKNSAEDGRKRPKARIGRFPGTKNGQAKERISGRITQDLKDAYVEWALSDQCAMGDLMERALVEFYQRHRASEP